MTKKEFETLKTMIYSRCEEQIKTMGKVADLPYWWGYVEAHLKINKTTLTGSQMQWIYDTVSK